jgi:hypothetical protein
LPIVAATSFPTEPSCDCAVHGVLLHFDRLPRCVVESSAIDHLVECTTALATSLGHLVPLNQASHRSTIIAPCGRALPLRDPSMLSPASRDLCTPSLSTGPPYRTAPLHRCGESSPQATSIVVPKSRSHHGLPHPIHQAPKSRPIYLPRSFLAPSQAPRYSRVTISLLL